MFRQPNNLIILENIRCPISSYLGILTFYFRFRRKKTVDLT